MAPYSERIGASNEFMTKYYWHEICKISRKVKRGQAGIAVRKRRIVMSVSGIDSGSTLSLVDFLQKSQEESNSILDSSTSLASSNRLLASRNSRAQNAYGLTSGPASTVGQAALNRALAEMNPTDGPVTFKDIAAYREQIEKEFTASLRVALAKEGVSLETEFSLVMDANGNIDVNCDDPAAKEAIRAYMAENSEACDQFGYIQALSNLERARQSPAAGTAFWSELRDSRKAYQTQAVEAFFSDALSSGMNYSSLMANFGAATGEDATDSASFYAGLSYTV